LSAPDYVKLRMKLWLGRHINETKSQYRDAGRPNQDFRSWLQAVAWETRLTVNTLRNWARWARHPDPVGAYEWHLKIDREGARWRREMIRRGIGGRPMRRLLV